MWEPYPVWLLPVWLVEKMAVFSEGVSKSVGGFACGDGEISSAKEMLE